MEHIRPANSKDAPSARWVLFVTLLSVSTWLPSLAHAHHDMDGDTPMTFLRGLSSGLAHPLIGLDHLVVLLLLGALCGSLKVTAWPVLSFAVMSVVGCLLHTSRVAWPLAELVLALSVVAAGPLAWLIARREQPGMLALFGAFGILHGYAYGDSMIGAGPLPLVGYLVGFVAIQLVVVWATVRVATRLGSAAPQGPRLRLVQMLSIASVCVGAMALYTQHLI